MPKQKTDKNINYSKIVLWGFSALWALFTTYLIISGSRNPLHTVVDFYTHIKGVEYLICVAFFVAFPIFYKYVDKRDKKQQNS